MGLQISISDSILQALRLPEQRVEQELRRELAIALYTQDILSFGKARELAEMDKYEFGQLLALRGVVRHYSFVELDDDLSAIAALSCGVMVQPHDDLYLHAI
jgi:predicted HTH domain antitoxin